MMTTFPNRGTDDRQSNRTPSGEQEADALLLARVRAGEEKASEVLVRKYSGRMLAVAHRFFRSEDDSADAVQDAFLSAFRSLDKFEGNATLGTWLHRIVVNACLMKLRSQSRSRQVPIDDLLPTFDETGHRTSRMPSWSEDAVSRLSREESRAQVRDCIDRLPEPYRTILLLRDIEELDTDQTAEQLGITPGAVKTRLHCARQALRTLLEPLVLAVQPN
jgi:RNA polymerase sigma-70 factor, ECF subfamily